MSLNIVELKPKDFDRAAFLLAKSFYDNPSHVYIFANPKTRLNLLQWGLKANLKLNLSSSEHIAKSFALVEESKPPGTRQIEAMGFWNSPQSNSISFISKINSGWLIMPFKFGRETYQRLVEVMGTMEQIKQEVLGKNKAWYLNNMVVTEELRGTGIGTKLLQHQLQSVVIPSNFPAILMTQKETNVRFYRKLGFEVARRSTIGTQKNLFTNWCLILPNN